MLGALPFLLAVLATASPPAAVTDKAGNRIEDIRLTPAFDGAMPSKGCTSDGSWCAEILPGSGKTILHVYTRNGSGTDLRYDLSKSGSEDEDGDYALWPRIIRFADNRKATLLGVTWNEHTMYSGGGGSASELRLLYVAPGQSEPEVALTVPVDGSLSIRACFGEEDSRKRSGACADEYGFTGRLTLDPTEASGAPRLIYSTQATSYPGHVSRSKDSLAAPPLHSRDLRRVTDPRCSFRRVFSMMPLSHSYRPDHPLPDCSDYTVP